jgi:hypothetical protein
MHCLRALILVSLAGCGAAALPPPEPYTPANSPDAVTGCPERRAAAYLAREELLAAPSDAHRRDAARAVFEHAACEAEMFGRLELPYVDFDSFRALAREARDQFRFTRMLYLEVATYGARRWTVTAHAGRAELHRAFAIKLRAAIPGSNRNVADDERAIVAAELTEAADMLDSEATRVYAAATTTSGGS